MRGKLWKGILVFSMCLTVLPTSTLHAADTQKGTAGSQLQGDYIVITNTNLTEKQSTGTLTDSVSTNSQKTAVPNAKQQNTNTDELGKISEKQQKANAISKSYTVGDNITIGDKTYICIGIGEHCYIWMEQNLKNKYGNKTEEAAKEMAYVYDGRPYEVLHTISGGIPYNDNSGKLSILLEKTNGDSGHYSGESNITAIHINTPNADAYKAGAFSSTDGLLVHEGQHALFNILTCKGDRSLAHKYSWLNEGLSVAAMDYTWGGGDANSWLASIADNTDIRNGSSLFYEDYRDSTAQDYSVPFLFVSYLINQKSQGYQPIPFLQNIYKIDATGKSNAEFLQAVLTENNLGNVKDVINNFYVAAIQQDQTGSYGFYGDTGITKNLKDWPLAIVENGEKRDLEPASAIVIQPKEGKFTVPADGGSDVTYTAVTKSKRAELDGEGTSADPYKLKKPADFTIIAKYPDAHYKLENDIDMSEVNYVSIYTFNGVIDGGMHDITGVSQPLINVNNGKISNLNVTAKIQGDVRNYIGVLTNENSGTITDCSIHGEVSIRFIGMTAFLKQTFGSIAAENTGVIKQCSSDAAITIELPSNTAYIGGLVGKNQGSLVNSYTNVSMKVKQTNAGNYDLYAGGLVGYAVRPFFAGYSISNVYSTSTLEVTADASIHKYVGSVFGFIEESFTNISSVYGLKQDNLPVSGNSNTAVTADALKTEAELKDKTTFTGWDFDSLWSITDTYPTFIPVDNITLTNVHLNKTTYYVGEQFSAYPSTFTCNGKSIALSEDMVSGFDSSKPGRNTITITYRGAVITAQVQINALDSVTKLELYPYASYKKTYVEGQVFNPDGIQLNVYKDNEIIRISQGFSYDLHDELTAEKTSVVISYGGQTLNLPITVTQKQPSKLSVIRAINQLQYEEDSSLNFDGLQLQIEYDNGKKSGLINEASFAEYGIHFAYEENGALKDLKTEVPLSVDMDGKYVYAIAGEQKVNHLVGKLVVGEKIKVDRNQTIYLTRDRENYEYSNSIDTGAYYNFKLLEGTLPNGITAEGLDYSNTIRFSGTPTTNGEYPLKYKVTDTKNENVSVEITITLVVVNVSSETGFETMVLHTAFNPGRPYDIHGIVQNGDVILRVPAGTDITALVPFYELVRNAEIKDESMHAGTKHDFTNPVVYTITAEDATTVKNHTVKVEFMSNDASLTSIKVGGNEISGFKKDNYTYDYDVNHDCDHLDLSAITSNEHASVEIKGNENFKTGINHITITVTSEDKQVSNDYVITVNKFEKEASSNAFLKSLQVNNNSKKLKLEPAFSNMVTSYKLKDELENNISELDVQAVAEDSNANIVIQGNKNLKTGSNTIKVIVTAEDQSTVKEYTVEATKKAAQEDSDAHLSSLSVEGYELIPKFSQDISSYHLNVSNETTAVKVTAVPNIDGAEITVDNPPLKVGDNTITITVTAKDKKTQKIYHLNIARAASSDSKLKALSIEGVALDKAFSADELSYHADVAYDVSSLKVHAETNHEGASYIIQNADQLTVGENTISIVVTPEDKSEPSIYQIHVVRGEKPLSDNAYLKSLSINEVHLEPAFNKETKDYQAVVPYVTETITINAAAEDTAAKVSGIGQHDLKVGENTFTLTVTAENGRETTYQLTITREQRKLSSNANLSAISGIKLKEAFTKEHTAYTADIASTINSLNILATPEDGNASIQISGQDTLTEPVNTITIIVTAEDGSSKQYSITVTKKEMEASANSNLQSLSGISLTPSFHPDVLEYQAVVGNETTELNLSAVSEDANASVIIQGHQNLQVGSNDVYITVTAEDGGSVKRYHITVEREAAQEQPQPDAEVKAVSEEINALLKGDINMVLTVTKHFQQLNSQQSSMISEQQKAQLNAAQSEVGKLLHVNGNSSVEGIPWHVGIRIEPVQNETYQNELKDVLTGREIFYATDIYMYDYLAEKRYDVKDVIKITVQSIMKDTKYTDIQIYHFSAKGRENLTYEISGDSVTFSTDSCSPFVFVGKLKEEQVEKPTLPLQPGTSNPAKPEGPNKDDSTLPKREQENDETKKTEDTGKSSASQKDTKQSKGVHTAASAPRTGVYLGLMLAAGAFLLGVSKRKQRKKK